MSHTPGPFTVGDTVSTHNHPERFWNTYITSPALGLVGIACGATRVEAEANARMIAKAPEMRAIVEAAAALHCDYCDRSDDLRAEASALLAEIDGTDTRLPPGTPDPRD